MIENSFKRNVLILLTGGVFAQLIPLLSNLILARLFAPDDFGSYATFFGVSSVLGSVSSFRYDITILLPKDNKEAKNLRVVSLLCLIFFILVTSILLVVFREELASLINFSENRNALAILIVFGIFFHGINVINLSTLTRSGLFTKITYGKIIYSLIMAIVSVLLGYIKFENLGLILGNISGLFFMSLYYHISVSDRINIKEVSFNEVYTIAKRYFDFPKLSFPGALLNGTSNLGLPVIITVFFSPLLAGIYFFTFKIVKSPVDLILQSIGQVYKSEANRLFYTDKNELINLTIKIQKKILVTIIPLMVTASILGPLIFKTLFGSEWENAGALIKFLSFFIICNSIYNPISAIGDLLGEQKVLLFFNTLLVCFQFGILFFFHSTLTFNENILLISIVNGLLFLIIDQYMKLKLKKHFLNDI